MAVQRVSATKAARWISSPGFFVAGRVETKTKNRLGAQKISEHTVKAADMYKMMADTWPEQIIGMTDQLGYAEDEGTMANTQEAIDQAAVEVEAAYQRFAKARDQLKSSLHNDTVSATSAASKVRTEMEKISNTIQSTLNVLLSEDMERAIVQAERMATALKAISELRTTKLSLAVFDTGEATQSERR